MDKTLGTDARVIKTKKAIEKAMIQLLKEKHFESISVKDICSTSNVSRATFYLHYKDKYDLVEKYQQQLIKKGTPYITNNIKNNRNEGVKIILTFLMSEGELMLQLLSKNGSTEVQNIVKTMIQQNAKKNIFPHLNIPVSSETELHYFIIFLSNALFGVIQEWVDRGRKETPEELIHMIQKISPIKI